MGPRCEGYAVVGSQSRRCLLAAGHEGECRWWRIRNRRTRPRSKTIATKKLTKAVMREFNPFEFVAELAMERPRTRGDCLPGGINCERPCPWVACKYHLAIDINPETGSLKWNFPDRQIWELEESCALDLADRGGLTLEEVGAATNLTRERIRQVEVRGLLKLKLTGALADAA